MEQLHEEQDYLLLMDQASIQYIMRRNRRNQTHDINKIQSTLLQVQNSVRSIESDLEKTLIDEQKRISDLEVLISTIEETLKDNFSLNFHRVFPLLNQYINQGFFEQLKAMKTVDNAQLQKELDRYQAFGQQIKESKKKELAYCYSIILSILKQAKMLIMADFQQTKIQHSSRLLNATHLSNSQQFHMNSLQRIDKLYSDSQSFKQILLESFQDDGELMHIQINKFRNLAKNLIQLNEHAIQSLN